MSTALVPIPADQPLIARVPEVLSREAKVAEAMRRLTPQARRTVALLAATGLLSCVRTGPPPPPPPAPTGLGTGRCACGQTISQNKPACLACTIGAAQEEEAQAWGKELAEKIGNQEMLDKVLEEAPNDAARAVILRYVKNHLAFEPEMDHPIEDCPKCGFRRGTMIAHQCIEEPPTIQ